MASFEKELRNLINIHGKDGESNTADFILADFMNACLNAYKSAVADRDVFDARDRQPVITTGHTHDAPPDRFPKDHLG